jgi:hypothetical protein
VLGSRFRAVSPVARSSPRARSAHGCAPRRSKPESAARRCGRASDRRRERRRCLPYSSRVRACSKGSSGRRDPAATTSRSRPPHARRAPRCATSAARPEARRCEPAPRRDRRARADHNPGQQDGAPQGVAVLGAASAAGCGGFTRSGRLDKPRCQSGARASMRHGCVPVPLAGFEPELSPRACSRPVTSEGVGTMGSGTLSSAILRGRCARRTSISCWIGAPVWARNAR